MGRHVPLWANVGNAFKMHARQPHGYEITGERTGVRDDRKEHSVRLLGTPGLKPAHKW